MVESSRQRVHRGSVVGEVVGIEVVGSELARHSDVVQLRRD